MWLYDYKAEEDNPYRQPPMVKITHMCYIDNLPDWAYPWHIHDDSYEVSFVVRGHGLFHVERDTLKVEPGSVVVTQPGVKHYFSSEEESDVRYYGLRFLAEPGDENELQTFFRNLPGDCAMTPAARHIEYFRETMWMLFHMHQSNGGHADGAFQSICLGLFEFVRELFANEALSAELSTEYLASDILDYILENEASGKKITLDSLAEEFHVSASHLSRVFSHAYGMSPINYLIYSRVTKATEYLLKTDLSVAEIAERLGYENATHFSHLFTGRLGCTPSEYRARNQVLPPEAVEES
ncbi:MAG: AraC family transcriptional regulator [Lachnospiraceae bacterium]|nr:AraC family transcriptional regulator [Lachnospiraceae bacterium]